MLDTKSLKLNSIKSTWKILMVKCRPKQNIRRKNCTKNRDLKFKRILKDEIRKAEKFAKDVIK